MPGWQTLIVCEAPIPPGFMGPFSPDSIYSPCNFNSFVTLIKNGVTDMVLISTLVVVVLLVYAGFILLTSGGNQSKYETVKGMVWKVVTGYVWILAAWVLVYTITKAVLSNEFNFLLGA